MLIGSTTTGGTAQSNIPFMVNAGIMFNRGVFSTIMGGMVCTAGGFLMTRNLGANSATTEPIYFNITFGTGSVYLSVTSYSNDAASMGVVVSFQGTTTTGFTANFYNSRSVTAPANTYGLNLVAFGKN